MIKEPSKNNYDTRERRKRRKKVLRRENITEKYDINIPYTPTSKSKLKAEVKKKISDNQRIIFTKCCGSIFIQHPCSDPTSPIELSFKIIYFLSEQPHASANKCLACNNVSL